MSVSQALGYCDIPFFAATFFFVTRAPTFTFLTVRFLGAGLRTDFFVPAFVEVDPAFFLFTGLASDFFVVDDFLAAVDVAAAAWCTRIEVENGDATTTRRAANGIATFLSSGALASRRGTRRVENMEKSIADDDKIIASCQTTRPPSRRR